MPAKYHFPRRRRDPRRTRVSVFAAGVPLHQRPAVHKCSKFPDKALAHFHRYVALIDGAQIARVVLHEGNLKHRSYKILADVSTCAAPPPPPAKASWSLPSGTRVAVPADMYRPSSVPADCLALIYESWPGALHAVKFDGYPHIVDYTVTEARRFKRI